jgi:NAD(P)-dependent dehydrogenase (short-subunit alcohol dehydrogenase family)
MLLKHSRKSALVTGGTRGIGEAIAKKLLDDNVDVTVTGTQLDGTAPAGCLYRSVDFTSPSQLEQTVEWISCQNFDILINNAGINRVSPFSEVLQEDFCNIHAVNVLAPFRLCQSVLPHMKIQKWGRVVNVSSIWGCISRAGRASYSASKFGLDGMTAALAAEVAQYGILANCVAPGFIDTELTKTVLGVDGMLKATQEIPARRLGRPEDIANLVGWLVSEENGYVCGQNIVIDGGFTRT